MVESVIAQWRQWGAGLQDRPKIIHPLGRGLSNQSFLLQAGEASMVLRINNSDKQLPGIDRQREAIIWQAASEAGVAPPLLYASDRYLVSSYVVGEQLRPNRANGSAGNSTFIDKAVINEVFRLIDKCHAIEIDIQQLDYAQHIQTYWNKIEQPETRQSAKPIDPALLKQRQTMQDFLQILSDQQPVAVLCHHDPVMANFVGTPQRLFLIDWEYAAKGLAVMDYAALAVEWGFSDATICTRTPIYPEALAMAKQLYRYLCRLWEAARSEPQQRPR